MTGSPECALALLPRWAGTAVRGSSSRVLLPEAVPGLYRCSGLCPVSLHVEGAARRLLPPCFSAPSPQEQRRRQQAWNKESSGLNPSQPSPLSK